MTLAQLLTLLYDRRLPQGYRSIDLTVKLGSKVISDPGLSKTDSFKRLRTEKGQLWVARVPRACRRGNTHTRTHSQDRIHRIHA